MVRGQSRQRLCQRQAFSMRAFGVMMELHRWPGERQGEFEAPVLYDPTCRSKLTKYWKSSI
jgi:hypothetical protein